MRAVVLLCLALSVLYAPPAARGDLRCTLGPSFGYRGAGTALLMAAATPDTVETGPGSHEVSGAGGHSGSGAPGPIYGQVMQVLRFGGADSALVARALEEHGGRVIVVPWDYDASCRRTRWTAGFTWVEPGDTGTYTLALRPPEQWIDGVPVYDADAAELEPYPSARYLTEPHRAYIPLPPRPWLTAAEYFEVLLGRPPEEDLRARPDSAWRAFLAWKQGREHLLARFPGTEVEAGMARTIRRIRLDAVMRDIEPLIAGTWRFTFSLHPAAGDPVLQPVAERSFHARTRSDVVLPWLPHDRPIEMDPDDPTAAVPRPDGYSLLALGAPTEESLPRSCRTRESPPGGYMYVIDPPPFTGRRAWDGWIEAKLVSGNFRDDAALQQFAMQSLREWGDRRRPGSREAPATFTLGDDGVLRVEQVIRTDDGRELRLRGERISSDVVDC